MLYWKLEIMDKQNDNQPQKPINEPLIPQKANGGKKSWKIAAIAAGAVLLAAGIGVYLWWNSAEKAEEESSRLESERQGLQEQIENLQEQVSDREGEEISSPSAEVETEDEYEGWLTYTNDIYSYQIKYPSEAAIKEAQKVDFALSQQEQAQGLTFDDVYNNYTGKICVQITPSLGYVNISAPANAEFSHVLCGRTGVGVCEKEVDRTDTALTNTEEPIVIDGKSYPMHRMETFCPNNTTDYTYTETATVVLDDKTRLEFGGAVGGDTGTAKEDYLAIRDDLVKIIKSYKKI